MPCHSLLKNQFWAVVILTKYVWVVVLLPVSVGPLHFREELLNHQFWNAWIATWHMSDWYIFLLFIFNAVLIDARETLPDDVLDGVHSVAINKHSRCFLAVEDEPQHQRQKQVSQASEEIECG